MEDSAVTLDVGVSGCFWSDLRKWSTWLEGRSPLWWMSLYIIPEKRWRRCRLHMIDSYSCVGATSEFSLELFIFLVYHGSGQMFCILKWELQKWCVSLNEKLRAAPQSPKSLGFSEFHPAWGGQRRHWHAKGRAGSEDCRVTARGENRMGKQIQSWVIFYLFLFGVVPRPRYLRCMSLLFAHIKDHSDVCMCVWHDLTWYISMYCSWLAASLPAFFCALHILHDAMGVTSDRRWCRGHWPCGSLFGRGTVDLAK